MGSWRVGGVAVKRSGWQGCMLMRRKEAREEEDWCGSGSVERSAAVGWQWMCYRGGVETGSQRMGWSVGADAV